MTHVTQGLPPRNGQALELKRAAPPGLRLRLLDRFVNPLVRLVLRSPLHRLFSGSIMLLTYRRRRGDERTIPVAYAQRGETLFVLVGRPEQKRWWRALLEPAPVKARVRGARRRGVARTLAGDGEEIASALRVYFERFPRAARVHRVARDAQGPLEDAALADAAQTAVILRVTLDPLH